MSSYTVIHDAIHGSIEVKGKIKKIIDHPIFERCNYIQQTGLAYRVYPSSTHSRKIHQIGTYYITHCLIEHLKKYEYIPNQIQELIEIGALIHDIGHGPGSHAFDDILIKNMIANGDIYEEHSWTEHEMRSIDILRYIANDINLNDEDVNFISEVIEPTGLNNSWEFTIVNNTIHGIDTDKLDYILRDSHMIGLKTRIDLNSIILHSRLINNTICFDKEIQDVLREVVFARFQIHRRLNDINVCKFDLSFADICCHEPIYSEIVDIINKKDCLRFSKLTDCYVLQHGDANMIKLFNSRDTYIPIDSFTSKTLEEVCVKTKKYQNKEYKILTNKLKICKNNNVLSNIRFYDRKTNEIIEISQSSIDSFPSFEFLTHIYLKKFD